MIRKCFLFSVTLFLSFVAAPIIYAHPIDVASVVIPLEGEKIATGRYKIPITWSVSIPELTTTLKINLPQLSKSEDLDLSHAKELLSTYLADKLVISTEKGNCVWQNNHAEETIVLDDLSLIGFHGFTVCPVLPSTITITNTAFFREFPYQTNIVIITKNGEAVLQDELTPLKPTTTYSSSTQGGNQSIIPQGMTGLQNGSLTSGLNEQFRSILLSSLPGAIVVAFLVGFLHSLEAGHSKTILASLMLHQNATLKQGFSYALVFTVTHVADILLFGLVLLILNSTINIFSLINQINRLALLALLWIAAYMFVNNLINLIKQKWHLQNHQHEHNHQIPPGMSFRKQLWIGFLTGLAPCVMGWSIFFLILSTKTVWAVFPVIIAFGGGIYLSLLGTTLLVYTGKQKVISRISLLSFYSPVISSLLLLIFSIVLILQ